MKKITYKCVSIDDFQRKNKKKMKRRKKDAIFIF